MNLKPPRPTSWLDFPTKENPHNRFKYASFDIEISQSVQYWNRETYHFLDYLGDLGGLLDALKVMALGFIMPFSAFAMRVHLLVSFFQRR